MGFIIVNGVGHHLPQRVGPAHTVRVPKDTACFYNDPVLGAQIAVRVVDILRPTLHGFVLAPASNISASTVVCFTQPAQKIKERIIGLVNFVKVAGSNRLSVSAPHGGVIAISPARRPGTGVTVEHLLLLLVGNARFLLELIRSGHPAFVVTGGSIVGIDTLGHR